MVDSKRAQYVKANYQLKATATGWEGLSLYQGKVFSRVEASTKAECCQLARCSFGHFNFDDEAEAFGEIFR